MFALGSILILFVLLTAYLSFEVRRWKSRNQSLLSFLHSLEALTNLHYQETSDWLEYSKKSGHLFTVCKTQPRAVRKLDSYARNFVDKSGLILEEIAKRIVEIERW